jgi:hypothetical protein
MYIYLSTVENPADCTPKQLNFQEKKFKKNTGGCVRLRKLAMDDPHRLLTRR